MASRLKERGGSGAKIMALKPSKTLITASLKEKPSSQKIPVAPTVKEISRPLSAGLSSVSRMHQAMPAASGKENPRPISAARPSVARSSVATSMKENPRPISAGRASFVRSENSLLKQAEKPAGSAASVNSGSVRCSTSLLPRGKFSDLRNDPLPQLSSSRERRSFSGFGALDKNLSGKGQLGRSSSGISEKSKSVVAKVLDVRNSIECLGAMSARNVSKDVDAKLKKADYKAPAVGAVSSDFQNSRQKNTCAFNLKPVDAMGVIGVEVLENQADEAILIDAKQSKENGHGNDNVERNIEEVNLVQGFLAIDAKAFDSAEEAGTWELVSKPNCDIEGGFCIVNTTNNMVNNCFNFRTSLTSDDSSKLGNDKGESANALMLDVHNNGEICQLHLEASSAGGHIGAEVRDDCAGNINQRKLHEKLALLEGKVLKIALEIKQTKELLDKNKQVESKFILPDIQKKVCGVEVAVHSLKDGVKSEMDYIDAGKVCNMQSRDVDSNMAMPSRCSSVSLKSSSSEAFEATFFPHEKVMSDFSTSVNSRDQDMSHGVVSKMLPDSTSSVQCGSASMIEGKHEELALESSEKLEEFDIPENNPPLVECVGSEDSTINQVYEIGRKISTGGWFVSEEAILLAHDDNSCSYYDFVNNEVKSEYKPPAGVSSNLWGDCWLIRAPGADGCSGRYILAASAGNALESGFCSWDFYTKDIKAFQAVGEKKSRFAGSSSSVAVAPSARSSSQSSSLLESQSCWYRPCGPLLISTSSRQRVVNAYDIRDGDLVMTWEVHSPVTEMEYSSPLQWRSRGKVVIAEKEAITLWDVNSLNPQPVLSVPCIGKKIYSLHVNNTDAEICAGVRQRASSTEVEGNDGVFCTQDSVNVFDFRIPSGSGLKISRRGANALSIFSLRDSIFIGSTEGRLPVKSSPRSQVEHFSLCKGKLVTTYLMPEFNSHYHHSSITQVWGNFDLVMGICGMGMFVFDAFKDEGLSSSSIYKGNTAQVKETIGPDDLYRPTFDYMESRTLIISRDRPAFWRYLS